MRTAREAFEYRVVVRRVAASVVPFRWEVQKADGIIPVHVSSDRFRSMETAYGEAQVWLRGFLAKPPSYPKGLVSRKVVQHLTPSTVVPEDDEDDAFSSEDDALDPGIDASDEGLIGTAEPIHPSSIG